MSETNPEEQAEDRDYQEIFGEKPARLEAAATPHSEDESSKSDAQEGDEAAGGDEVEPKAREHSSGSPQAREHSSTSVAGKGEEYEVETFEDENDKAEAEQKVMQDPQAVESALRPEDRLSLDDAAADKESMEEEGEEAVSSLPVLDPHESAQDVVASLPLSRGGQADGSEHVQSLPLSPRQDPPRPPAGQDDEIPEDLPSRQNSADAPAVELSSSRRN
eukprot:766180-Hanusia_phi.AAC.3